MKPSETARIQDFIDIGLSIDITYYKTSILEKVNNIEYPVHNILYDYMDELNAAAVTIALSDAEYNKYIYSPKLLAHRLYGYTDFYFILMVLNGVCDVRDFNFKKVKVLRQADLSIVNRIINAEKKYLDSNRDYIREKE